MAVAAQIVQLLKQKRVPYTSFSHALAYTAQEVAAVSHTQGRSWSKVVVCIADDLPIQAVLPAHYRVDFDRLRLLAGARSLRLATEDEIAGLYPGCDVGAMPPFGPLYGHRVFVDRSLVGEPDMTFNAGTHTDAVRMHYSDFAELAQPTVGEFGLAPARPPSTLRKRRSSRRA